jgi:amidophosphoribosyltransferase
VLELQFPVTVGEADPTEVGTLDVEGVGVTAGLGGAEAVRRP